MISISFMGMRQESGGAGLGCSRPWLGWDRSGQAGVPDMGVEERQIAGSLGPMQRTPAEHPMLYVPQNLLLKSRDPLSPSSLLLGYDIPVPGPK